MIEIITDKDKWNMVVKLADQADFYHTYDYHQITKEINDIPILIRYNEDNKMIALPLMLRKIEDTPYFDTTSVYGYVGPLTNNISEEYDNSNFKTELQDLLRERNILSVFMRLNPFLKNQEITLKKIGSIFTLGNVVNIDLTKSFEVQKQCYSRSLRTNVNKSRRCYRITKARTEKEVLQFISMYYESMQRVNATPNYFFEKEYFFNLLKSTDFNAEIILAVKNESDEVIGGSLFIKKNNTVHYHLSGVKNEYLGLNPVKMLIDEMRIMATQDKLVYFNLGGGLGSKNDSLFKFKSDFSKDFKVFKTWRYIINEKVYDTISHQNKPKDCYEHPRDCPLFFPCYRCNK